MKFLYQYKTSDGTRHDGVCSAASRDAAYDKLKSEGVKPFNVVPAPGVVNRLLCALGRRGVALVVVSFLLVCAIAVAVVGQRRDSGSSDDVFLASMRRQIIGDAAVIEDGIRTGWKDVFAHEGERFLASFAIPGVAATVRTTSVDELSAALARQVAVSDEDSIEVRQIKSMVEGLKRELRAYVADGGTIAQYGERIVERQEMEIGFYNRVKTEIELAAREGMSEAAVEKWRSGNNELRRMGIRLVPFPKGETDDEKR